MSKGDWSEPQHAALIVFARYPIPGKVKTRLAEAIGNKQAAEFYRLCAGYIFKECAKTDDGIRSYLFYSEQSDLEKMMQWAGNDFIYTAQGEGDLGERMRSAFHFVFREQANKAIIIGTDVPDVSTQYLDEALRSLEKHDIVIGPSYDGGYYLLGMEQVYPDLFTGIPWGSDSVFASTMNKIKVLGLSVKLLPMLHDIDTKKDMEKWCATASKQHVLLPVMQRLLVDSNRSK